MLGKEIFADLSKKNLFLDENNFILKSPRNMLYQSESLTRFMEINSINQINYYCKYSYDDRSLQPIVSSKLFNETGILSPPIFLAKDENGQVFECTQDLTTLPQFAECVEACDLSIFFKLHGADVIFDPDFGKSVDKWDMLSDKNAQETLLSVMTPACYEQYINLFLIDELRTETDRHDSNFFFYKTHGASKFEGVIAIDLSEVRILDDNIKNTSDFQYFLGRNYSTNTPKFLLDKNCLYNRINKIKSLLEDGILSKANITALKKALSFDFAKELKKAGEHHHLTGKDIKRIYDPVAFLWEFNQQILGKQLGM